MTGRTAWRRRKRAKPTWCSPSRLASDVLSQVELAQRTTINTLMAALVAAFILTLLVLLLVIRAMLRQMGGEPRAAVEAAARVAAGDLSQAIEVKSGDKSSLMAALSVMQANLRERGESDRELMGETLAAESEIAGIVSAANGGDFSGRLAIEGKQGFFKVFVEGINGLMQTSEAGLGDLARVLGGIARSDLTERIHAT